MRRAFAIVVLAAAILCQAVPVYASCTTHTYWLNGQMIMCTTCCFGSYCNTTCV